ncbi:hypothetical protein FJ423_27070 [Mesorhizobium sp. B2-8-9]|nr:hypothetical protein FJ423_27070 [Mesorhizobium sp. B2-8-9]
MHESALPLLKRVHHWDADLRRNFHFSSMSRLPGRALLQPKHDGHVVFRSANPEEDAVNGIIYLVGLVVIVLFILSFFGLR